MGRKEGLVVHADTELLGGESHLRVISSGTNWDVKKMEKRLVGNGGTQSFAAWAVIGREHSGTHREMCSQIELVWKVLARLMPTFSASCMLVWSQWCLRHRRVQSLRQQSEALG